MITIDINKEKFEKYVSAATDAESTIFDMLGDYITVATNDFVNDVLGVDIQNTDLEDKVTEELERGICLCAFASAIPELDLVLTDNGFGVVSNSNVAPASADRVDKLRVQVIRLGDESIDRLIDVLCGNAKWYCSANALLLVSSVYYKSDILRKYGGVPDATRADLRKMRPAISAAESQIIRHISRIQFKRICEGIRMNNLTNEENTLLYMIREAVGFIMNKDVLSSDTAIADMENYLEGNIDSFSEYKSSDAYQVKHFETYANDKDDTTYFF